MTPLKFLTPTLFLISLSCDTTEPPPPLHTASIQLSVEDASCTEAWLKVSLTDANPPRTIALRRDGQIVLTAQLTANDTLLIDEGLLPNHAYTYQAVRMRDGVAVDASANTQATTLDTTSHDWSFSIDTLGDASSVLYDVAIINDTLAYAVGEMYLRDSTGQLDPLLYNLAEWDGQQWEIKRVTVTFRGSQVTVPLEGVFAHSATDIWVAGSIPIHGNGVSWIGYDIQALVGAGTTVSRMWGTTSEMYFVGRAGNIVRFSNGTWQRIVSGTTLDIQDVWGGMHAFKNTTEVIAVASYFPTNQGMKMLWVNPAGVQELPATGIPWRMSGLWFSPGKRYYVVGDGLMVKRAVEDTVRWSNLAPGLTQDYMRDIVGNSLNDIIVVGDFGNMLHYNGVHWRSLQSQTAMSGIYLSVAIRGNMIVAVGLSQGRAIALRGY